jgi:hypothetical protein
MGDFLNHLEAIYGGRYALQRVEIQNARRLSVAHLDQTVTIDLFESGKVNVGGTNSPLKEEVKKHLEEFRKDPMYFEKQLLAPAAAVAITPEQAIAKIIKQELLLFLPAHDRQALIAAYQVILADLALADYSPAVMPVGRVYEGFLGELVVRTGMCTKTLVQDPTYNLTSAFDTREAKTIKARVSTHEAKMDSAKQRLKEFRHIQLHSQSSQFVQHKTRDDARRFIERVLGDMQALFDYFKDYFVV